MNMTIGKWHAPRHAQGLSLIELMVAIAIGMVIVGALIALFLNVTRTNNEMAKMNRQIENGRFAIQLLQDDLVHAGFWGDLVPRFEDRNVSAPDDMPNAIPDPCKVPGTWVAADRNNLIGIPVQADVGTCAAVANQQANTDVLVVRHAEPSAGTACGGEVCFQASQCNAEINATPPLSFVLASSGHVLHKKNCLPAVLPVSSGDIAVTRKFTSSIYYIRDYSVVAGDGIPTLMRSEFIGGEHQAAQPLIEGIEGFRIEYGIDNIGKNGAAVSYVGAVNRGDGIPDTFVNSAGLSCISAANCDAANVVAVRIHVLARSSEITPGYTDTKVYTLGSAGSMAPFNDGFKRHVFTTTVRLVNPSGRRETP